MNKIYYCNSCHTLFRIPQDTVNNFINSEKKCCKNPDISEMGEETDNTPINSKDNNDKNRELEFRRLQMHTLELLARKDAESYYKATEHIVSFLKNYYNLFTITDDKNAEVWFYNSENGIYEPNGETKIKIIIREIVQTAYTSVFAKNVLDKLKAERNLQVTLKEFIDFHYENLYEIPVKNGILNLQNKTISAFTHEKKFFVNLPIIYNPAATCPNTTNHFKEILKSPDDVKIMEEIYGAGLLREYKIEKAIIYVGNGRNGKGKSLEHARRFFGAENCSHIPLKTLSTESFEIEDMFGKLMNISGDLSSEAMKDTDLFKMATGRDTLLAKRKFRTAIKFINYAKNLFACNDLPRVYDSSKGFWSRWVLLEFPFTFVTQEDYDKAENKTNLKIMNPDQVEKITTPEELSGWLNCALEGLNRLLTNKDYSYTIGSQQVKEFWMRRADSFMAFCLDYIEADVEATVTKQEVRRLYSKYCKEYNVKMVSEPSMKITLETEYGASDGRLTEEFTRKQVYFWEGIKIKREAQRVSIITI